MILNCMGFLTSPLYLFSEFFAGKATEHLIGEGVTAEHLNESRLGRVMDQLYEYGITLMFVKIASEMSKKFGISTNHAHLDGTSIAVHGKYETVEGREKSIVENESGEPLAIAITQGYSRDHRPDLKQFTWHLMTSEEEGIPLYMNVGDGNKTDQSAFPEVIKAFRSEWEGEQPELYVMDAAFYSEANLQEFGNSIEWISRVPATLKAAQEIIESLLPEQFNEQYDKKGYRFCVVCSTYAGIKQQWVVVESLQRMEADLKTAAKKIEKALNKKALKSLINKSFACEADTLSAVTEFEKTLKFHNLSELQIISQPHYSRRGRPNPEQQPTHYSWHIQAGLVENPITVAALQKQAGRFILATNSVDSEKWADSDILREYKGQQSTERGFRFLKDPLFFASTEHQIF